MTRGIALGRKKFSSKDTKMVLICLCNRMSRKAGKIIQLDDCRLNVQAGMRGRQAVVACGIIFGPNSPMHYLQIDRHMESLDAAIAYVEAVNESIAREIYAELVASDGHVIEAFNRVFSASAQQAATRIHQLDAAANKGRRPR